MANRQEEITRKIRGLLAKTVENGCTEQEAIAAANIADKLMREYDVSYDNVAAMEQGVKSEKIGKRIRTPGLGVRKKKAHEVVGCTMEVGTYYDCRVWCNGPETVFFGTESDTAIAHDMIDMLVIAMENEFRRFRLQNESDVHGNRLRGSFMSGFNLRINARFRQMKASRTAVAEQSRALVVLKDIEIGNKMVLDGHKRDFGLVGVAKKTSRSVHHDSYMAGQEAGNRASLGKSLGTGMRQIGN